MKFPFPNVNVAPSLTERFLVPVVNSVGWSDWPEVLFALLPRPRLPFLFSRFVFSFGSFGTSFSSSPSVSVSSSDASPVGMEILDGDRFLLSAQARFLLSVQRSVSASISSCRSFWCALSFSPSSATSSSLSLAASTSSLFLGQPLCFVLDYVAPNCVEFGSHDQDCI
jgi:hypothetical protein